MITFTVVTVPSGIPNLSVANYNNTKYPTTSSRAVVPLINYTDATVEGVLFVNHGDVSVLYAYDVKANKTYHGEFVSIFDNPI